MKLITRDTDYAVRALLFFAKSKEKIVSVTDLVQALRIPRPFLRKILQILNKRSILKSHKGQGGGFELSLPPRKVFLTDLIEIFQGSFQLNECLFKKNICPDRETCPLRNKINSIERSIISELKSITIQSLSNDGGQSWPKGKL
jgi:Rrf2 family protein